MKFEWAEEKNKSNINKHGIDFADAQFVFLDPCHWEIYDEEHSISEERWKIIGKVKEVLVVIVTIRGEVTRIVSAREATPLERKAYYEYSSQFFG
jgi:uncharacterized DUF497 family protein